MREKIYIQMTRLEMEAIANAIHYKIYDNGSRMAYLLMDLEDAIQDGVQAGIPEQRPVQFSMNYYVAVELYEIIKDVQGLDLVSRILNLKIAIAKGDQTPVEIEVEDCGCGEEDIISVEFTPEQLQAVWSLMVDNNTHNNPLEPLIDQIGEYLQAVDNQRWYELSDSQLWELYKEGFGEKNIQEVWFQNVVSREEIIEFLQELEVAQG